MDDNQREIVFLAEKGHNVFVNGPPGTGKTYTLGKTVDRLLINDKKVYLTASTGKASSVLKGKLTVELNVTTIHRFAGILDGRFTDDELVDIVLYKDEFKRTKFNIENAQVLIIDEVSMLTCRTINQIDFLFRQVRKKNNLPMGGIQVILAGDLGQLAPVPNIDYGDNGEYLIVSPVLQNFHIVTLTNIHRQEEPDLITAIHEIAKY